MSELILSSVIIYLLVERYFNGKSTQKIQKDLLRLIKAKNLEEVTQAELVDKVKPTKEPTPPSDLIPTEQLSDEQFDKMIGGQVGRN